MQHLKTVTNRIRTSRFYRGLSRFGKVTSDKKIDVYSATAAFYIYMSFIPFLLILLSTIKYLPFTKSDLLTFIDGVLPVELNSMMIYIIDELYSRGIGTLSVSIVAAIWASAKGVFGITKGLNEITGVKEKRSDLFFRARSAITTVFLMLGMILMLVISVFGNMITNVVSRYVTIPHALSSLIEVKNIIMFAVLFILYMFFYCVLPYRKIRILSQIYGAAAASLLWILFTKIFSLYLSTFTGYSMYGSFAVILVIGIWLYVGMYLMFLGALLNLYIESVREGKVEL
ncbi:MAG: YihY/virulence factor BrkB family protein [Lachnospiraceae bacterium]|nr:YihY/virulence factor BrkB family protein [Lachnospiraceae bacterium]